ncbi:MAG: hypothetical protein ACRD0H_31720 [Actinomycetes bacterium]
MLSGRPGRKLSGSSNAGRVAVVGPQHDHHPVLGPQRRTRHGDQLEHVAGDDRHRVVPAQNLRHDIGQAARIRPQPVDLRRVDDQRQQTVATGRRLVASGRDERIEHRRRRPRTHTVLPVSR